MIQLLPIQAADYPALAVFCANFPGDIYQASLWEERFLFWWEKNPVFSAHWIRGWMLLEETTIVGMLADIPSSVQLFGQQVLVSNFSTWRVQEAYQGESLRLLSKALTHAKDRLVFNTTPTLDVAAILRSFRFCNLADTLCEYLFVTNTEFLAWQLRKKKIPKFLAYGLSWTIRWWHKVVRMGFSGTRRNKNGLQVQLLDHVGEEFDRLWQRTADYFTFSQRRTSLDLQWLVYANPIRNLVLFGCYDAKNILTGYALFAQFPVSLPFDTIHFVCLDIWSLERTPWTFVALIQAAIDYSEQNRFAMVIVPEYNALFKQAALLSGWSIQRTRPSAIYCRFPKGITFVMGSGESCLSGYFGDIVF
ncbi:MAG: hypothetical protein H7832_00290 [Magnetococcus sp. DMHC-6]